MLRKLLMLLSIFEFAEGQPACLPSQPVEAVEGGSATLQCRLDPPIDLSSEIVEWNRGNGHVHVYRGQHDDPDPQMLQYRDRTALNHGDLTTGVVTLTISNVSLSDNGSYEVYLPKLKVTCLTHLTVDAEKRNDVRKAVLPCVLILAAVAVVVVVSWKRGVIRICKKEGEPKTSEGDQQSAAEEGLVGSEVKDNNNQPSDTVY